MQAGLIHAGFGRRETGRGGSLKPSEAASSAPVVKNTAAAANPRSARRCKLWAIEGCLLEISIACVNDRFGLDRGSVWFVPRVHACPEHARVYFGHQAVVVRPGLYPIRVSHFPVERNLRRSDQLPHARLLCEYVRLILGRRDKLGQI